MNLLPGIKSKRYGSKKLISKLPTKKRTSRVNAVKDSALKNRIIFNQQMVENIDRKKSRPNVLYNIKNINLI
jgi:hypothetical protein